jgi:transcription termination factor Rho
VVFPGRRIRATRIFPVVSGGGNSNHQVGIVSNEGFLGVLEVLGSGSGFVRRPDAGYTPGDDDIYVNQKLIQRFGLRTGDEITGTSGQAPGRGKSPPLTHVHLVNDQPPTDMAHRPQFTKLGAKHPDAQLTLECDRDYHGQPDPTNRIIDLFCPFGKGQRAMIVSDPPPSVGEILRALPRNRFGFSRAFESRPPVSVRPLPADTVL